MWGFQRLAYVLVLWTWTMEKRPVSMKRAKAIAMKTVCLLFLTCYCWKTININDITGWNVMAILENQPHQYATSLLTAVKLNIWLEQSWMMFIHQLFSLWMRKTILLLYSQLHSKFLQWASHYSSWFETLGPDCNGFPIVCSSLLLHFFPLIFLFYTCDLLSLTHSIPNSHVTCPCSSGVDFFYWLHNYDLLLKNLCLLWVLNKLLPKNICILPFHFGKSGLILALHKVHQKIHLSSSFRRHKSIIHCS